MKNYTPKIISDFVSSSSSFLLDAMDMLKTHKRICILCGWIGDEQECFGFKRETGARLCPECYAHTEVFK